MAEDRELFRVAMAEIGLETARARIAHSMEEAWRRAGRDRLPDVIRPLLHLGGSGGGIAYNREEFEEIVKRGSTPRRPTRCCSRNRCSAGKNTRWKWSATSADNCIIVCSIENLDPMGVHTGDSITVAPAQTLTDKEYQRLRDASIAVLRKIGVDTGGSNVQFAVNPRRPRGRHRDESARVALVGAGLQGHRLSRSPRSPPSSAVGYTLDELKNDITGGARRRRSSRPSTTWSPRFRASPSRNSRAPTRLTTQMKSVGEAMAIGRTFQESLQKALRSLETGSTASTRPDAAADR
jgi:carbamoyl-phosphate synthase large subunit